MPEELTEAGAVLSKKNHSALRGILKTLHQVLKDATGADPLADDEQADSADAAESAPIVSEATVLTGEIVPLVEKAVRSDNTVPLKIIDAGWGSSGYYAPDMLKRDGPKVFTSGTHMYLDHPTESEALERPERSVRELAGVLVSDAAWQDNGPSGAGLYADAAVFGPIRDVLDDIAPHIGVSIRASGVAENGEADGKQGRVITSLVSAESVDFVTRAGRGGQVLSLMESVRAGRSGGTDAPKPKEADMSEQALKEAQDKINAQEAQIQRLQEAQIIRDARDQVNAALASTTLHEMTRTRLRESLVSRAPVADGALDSTAFATVITEAINAAVAEYAAITGSGAVRGMGDTQGVGAPDLTALESEFDETLTRLGVPVVAKAS